MFIKLMKEKDIKIELDQNGLIRTEIFQYDNYGNLSFYYEYSKSIMKMYSFGKNEIKVSTIIS